MAEFYDAAEQFETSSDESEVCISCLFVLCTGVILVILHIVAILHWYNVLGQVVHTKQHGRP